MRVAALDVGTNSVRLLVSDSGTDLHRETRIVRLGQGVDRTGRLDPEALHRTAAALRDYAAVIASLGAQRVRLVATSATRDASNRDDFVAVVNDTLGIEPDVVTGDEEAALSFAGAAGAVPGLRSPILLVDLGGGSTELVLGSPDDPAGGLRARSMDVGSVRMTERHLRSDPPTAAEVAAVEADVRAALDRAGRDVPLHDTADLVGVAGTVTTVVALALGLSRYDSQAVHGARISRSRIEEVTEQLVALDHDGRAGLAVVHPGRRDVITAGAIVLRTVVAAAGVDSLVASERDILDGIARSLY